MQLGSRSTTGGSAMSNATYFIQECPTCGRQLQIRVEHLGRRLICQHCQGQLLAADPSNSRIDRTEMGNALLQRANELLKKVASQKMQLQ
jgi:hypothetical protein